MYRNDDLVGSHFDAPAKGQGELTRSLDEIQKWRKHVTDELEALDEEIQATTNNVELLDEKLEDLEREKGSIHAALMDEVSRRPEVVEKMQRVKIAAQIAAKHEGNLNGVVNKNEFLRERTQKNRKDLGEKVKTVTQNVKELQLDIQSVLPALKERGKVLRNSYCEQSKMKVLHHVSKQIEEEAYIESVAVLDMKERDVQRNVNRLKNERNTCVQQLEEECVSVAECEKNYRLTTEMLQNLQQEANILKDQFDRLTSSVPNQQHELKELKNDLEGLKDGLRAVSDAIYDTTRKGEMMDLSLGVIAMEAATLQEQHLVSLAASQKTVKERGGQLQEARNRNHHIKLQLEQLEQRKSETAALLESEAAQRKGLEESAKQLERKIEIAKEKERKALEEKGRCLLEEKNQEAVRNKQFAALEKRKEQIQEESLRKDVIWLKADENRAQTQTAIDLEKIRRPVHRSSSQPNIKKLMPAKAPAAFAKRPASPKGQNYGSAPKRSYSGMEDTDDTDTASQLSESSLESNTSYHLPLRRIGTDSPIPPRIISTRNTAARKRTPDRPMASLDDF